MARCPSKLVSIALCGAALSAAAQAGVLVRVSVAGTIAFNQINGPPLSGASAGDQVILSFDLDSDLFVDSANFPTRGYPIATSSFQLTVVGKGALGLQNPFPPGQTPYFVLRNDDPAVDGFWTSTDIDFPVGVPLAQAGIFGAIANNYSVTYGGTTLTSLEILDALGSYDFAALQVFNWTLDDGPFNAMGIDFQGMQIEVPPASYCTAGTSASGCQASISTSGVASASASSGFSLVGTGAEGSKQGLFFFGTNGQQANSWGNGTSFQCVVPPVKRGTNMLGGGTTGACDGTFAQDMNALWCASCPKPAHNPGAGAILQAQLWYRDPFNTSNQTTSLSDAVQLSVGP